MAIEYPSALPLPLRQDYRLQQESALQRTRMEGGRARVRRRFSSVPSIASASWVMDEGQAQIFESWFHHKLSAGAEWFECPLKTPVGLKSYEARFVDVYEGPALVGRLWRFTAQIEIREAPILSEEDFDLTVEYLTVMPIIDKSVNLVWPSVSKIGE